MIREDPGTGVKLGVVIPVGAGREDNVALVMQSLHLQDRPPDHVVVVLDGPEAVPGDDFYGGDMTVQTFPKHEPGMEQPRNAGVRALVDAAPDVTHVWFLDSDVVVEPDCCELLEEAILGAGQDRIVVAPYDWLPAGMRPGRGGFLPPEFYGVKNDPRWAMFNASPPNRVYQNDLSAGLACFSGNLVWNVAEFQRVGGFWSELHHGRCEDGELGLRAVAMGVPISFQPAARGWHLHHPVNIERTLAANERDVPMLNARHPWVQGSDVFMVDRDGKAFDVRCHTCQQIVPTGGWWAHAENCGDMTIEAHGA